MKKDDDGRDFLSRLVARSFKPRRQGPRDEEAFFAARQGQEHVQD